MKNTLYDFVHLFYPEVCKGCGTNLFEGEEILCLSCFAQAPVAYDMLESDEKVKDLFLGRSHIEHARSLFFYEKIGIVQSMIHQLKYEGQEEISSYLGKWMAGYMVSDKQFDSVTHVIPVPVHPKRLKTRGYNQVTGFGKTIAEKLDAVYLPDLLFKTKHTINQARLGQVKRSDESQSPYQLNTKIDLPEHSHILMVDDVITTGTTLSMCLKEIDKISKIKISIATMAISV